MQWKELYAACVTETDSDRLEKLVFDTEDAMFLRFQELAHGLHVSNEVDELKQAATGLLEFKVKKLGWPDPKIEAPNTTRPSPQLREARAEKNQWHAE